MSFSRPRRARVVAIVERAHEHPEAARLAWLHQACEDDPQLLADALDLLGADDSFDDLLPGGAQTFIDEFKRELGRATHHAELRMQHTQLLEHLLGKLRRLGARANRFELKSELGRGGMGEVFRVFDRLLRRDTALKRVRTAGASPAPAAQIRFLQEAQVVAQLDHPNVPTVHEIGVDDEGRLFFTMPLVVGESLAGVLDRLPDATSAWREPRILEGLLQAARAIAHAHERGVIHRDLKPANLMLGRFGAMHVVDWGIARVVDDDRAREVLYGSNVDPQVASDLSDAAADDTAFVTAVGSTLGTPSFMSPEQAAPDGARVGPPTDIYSIGAILYQVLTGRPAYTDLRGASGREPTAREITARVRSGPPTPLARLTADAPPELAAICERAMERDPRDRFQTVQALVEDLEAYLAGRVVRSYERGAWPEVRKWVLRNRTVAASFALALVFAVVGAAGMLTLQVRRDTDARRQVGELLRLSAIQDAELLGRAVESLWPARPALLPELRSWANEATELHRSLGGFERQRTELEARATRADGAVVFSDSRDAWLHHQLGAVIESLRAFGDRASGPLFGVSQRFGPGIASRIELAERELRRSSDPEFRRAWNEAVEAVGASELYGGVRLAREDDLLPLGANAAGLFEFALLSTGLPPVRGEHGWDMQPESAVVLVLIPGGTFLMGAQKDDPEAPNWATAAPLEERAPHAVTLAPYYMSKYELTDAQWQRIAGYSTAKDAGVLPVTSVDWEESRKALAHVDLALPTEAQWERAARGETSATWWTGHAGLDLLGLENVCFRRLSRVMAARFVERHGAIPTELPGLVPVHVGAENPFGLVQTLGNVQEWCRDVYGSYALHVTPDVGERVVEQPHPYRISRGGSYVLSPYHARCSRRAWRSPERRGKDCGVRPARRARLVGE